MKKIKNKFKSISNKVKILIIVLVAFISFPFIFTFSRYAIEKVTEHYYDSKSFYFNSPTLNGSTYNLYSWDGQSNYSFDIQINNSKDNLAWSETDINYEYSLTCNNGDVQLDCIANTSGTLLYSSDNKTINTDTITIQKGLNQISSGDVITVIVNATSTNPYVKTLSATFNFIINTTGISYQILDEEGSLYLTLLITNVGSSKNINIEFDSDLINVDNTNSGIINNTIYENSSGVIDKVVISADIDNIYSLRFYKNNINENYSLNGNVFTIY